MSKITRIGLATDFSKISKHAEKIALTLRDALNAELFVIHAFHRDELRIPAPYYFMPGVDTWINDREKEMLELGQHTVEKLAEELGNAKGIFLEGKPGPKLVSFAQKIELDMLIMGTHGYSGFNRLMLGSVTEYVLRHAHCPVLTVKYHDEDDPTQ